MNSILCSAICSMEHWWRKTYSIFDAWASTFGETVTALEIAPEGNGYRLKTRFARFYNLPELMQMFGKWQISRRQTC